MRQPFRPRSTRRRSVRLAGSLLLVPLIAVAGLLVGGPAAAAYGPQLVDSASVVEVGNTARPEVVLTFDAGSDAGNTDGILTVLRREDIRATFGLTGVWAEQNPQLAQRIAREGHQIVNHTYNHRSFTGASDRTDLADTPQMRSDQLERAEAVFRSLGLTSAGWFRPPYGDVCRAGSTAAVCKSRGPGNVEADVARAGYSTELMWTVDTLG